MSVGDVSEVVVNPEQGKTRLIERPRDPEVLTLVRETDCRTALTRGLAEYIRALRLDFAGGNQARFLKVLETFSEPEDPATYPSAIVYAETSGEYDYSALTPNPVEVSPGVYLRATAEYTLDMTVEVWTTTPHSRMAHVSMLEDAFDPVGWQSGFVLELPHYFGARASYQKLSSTYEDEPSANMARWRRASFTLAGQVTQYRPAGRLPRNQTRVDLVASDATGEC